MTSATDELRRLLDERGVEWKGGRNHANYTSWDASDWRMSAEELADGTLFMRAYSVKHLSPEQAAAATLGPGMCHDMYTDDDEWFACSECNAELRVHEPFGVICSIRYCPNCGRKVVDA